jgi:hypothetical protein
MTTTREALHDRLLLIASDSVSFNRATKDKFGGTDSALLATFLHEYADGKCCSCGQDTVRGGALNGENTSQVGHLLAATFHGMPSKVRAGRIPGNLANMCFTCNNDAALIDKSFSADDVIPELVPLIWPTFRRTKKGESEYVRNARALRKW